ncbi:Nif3-like dinuclear metal center hexameric protein [Kistimonas asteriae]|uniref:Nif3-like dinuclear metal center hexameric protein n=1 Tax=Kistimonas asteriae TaxID=517724 RepID=UPI001BA9E12D|nr:Nif3-like dinuclear metal center hexameric protein [Kistimonas asteriae]
MSVLLNDLIDATEQKLKPWLFKDYAPNGLQVEGRREVRRVVSGVTACEALLDAAIAADADAILVHHGYFWRGENACLTGMKRRRIGKLIEHDISLIAYHLPLDAHPELGNNACLGKMLGFETTGGMDADEQRSIGLTGRLGTPQSLDALGKQVEQALGRTPLLVSGGNHTIKKVAWCTGGAQGYIEKALDLGADAYISGEISEQTTHFARENGIHYIAAGHHATERYGVQALGEWLSETLGITHQFVDIDNPV